MNGAQAEGCSPVASAFAAGHDVCRPVKPNTIAKSLAIGNPADGPYALDLARRTRRLGGRGQRRGDPRGHRAAGRDDGRLHRDRRAASRRPCSRKLAARGDIDPDERVVLVITGEGLKTLDAVRGTFETQHDRSDASRRSRPACRERRDRLMAVRREDPHAAAGRRRRRGRDAGRRRDRAGGAGRPVRALRASCARASSDEDGSLRRFVNVYLAGEDIRFLDGLATPVADGAELTILPAVAGG